MRGCVGGAGSASRDSPKQNVRVKLNSVLYRKNDVQSIENTFLDKKAL